MAMKRADPLKSKGARLERKAVRAYVRRVLRHETDAWSASALKMVLRWLAGRQKRYDARPGGLGRR
jgi:hypothetical protein